MRGPYLIALAVLLGFGVACGARDEAPVREGFLPVSGGDRLYYRVSGTGPDTIVILHGGPGLHSRYLDDAFAELATDHTIITYDQRGRGRSDFPADTLALSADTDIADLDAVRAFFQLDHVTLVGHGWGAALSALYAIHHPEHVARLLLVSPMFPRADYLFNLTFQRAAGADTSGLDGLMAARLAGEDRTSPRGFCRRYWGAMLSPAVVRDRSVIRRLSTPMCDAPAKALGRIELVNRRVTGSLGAWNWEAQLRSVRIPALVIQGEAPHVTERDEGSSWVAAARDWAASLPNARLELIGTVPQFPWLDAGPRFMHTVRRFLDHPA